MGNRPLNERGPGPRCYWHKTHRKLQSCISEWPLMTFSWGTYLSSLIIHFVWCTHLKDVRLPSVMGTKSRADGHHLTSKKNERLLGNVAFTLLLSCGHFKCIPGSGERAYLVFVWTRLLILVSFQQFPPCWMPHLNGLLSCVDSLFVTQWHVGYQSLERCSVVICFEFEIFFWNKVHKKGECQTNLLTDKWEM